MDKATWEWWLGTVVKIFLTAIFLIVIKYAIEVIIHTATPEHIQTIQNDLEQGLRTVRPTALYELYVEELNEIWSGIPSEQKIEQSDTFQQCVPTKQSEIREDLNWLLNKIP
jgi:hypothetical protein